MIRVLCGLFLLLTSLSQETFAQEVQVFETFDEFEHILEQADEKTYIVNFWATWCAPCIAELPYFEQIGENYRDDGIEVILTSLDFKDHLERRVLPFVQKKGLKSRVVLMADPKANDWIDRVDHSWSGAIPATLIYNKGKRQFMEREFASYEELEEVLNRFRSH